MQNLNQEQAFQVGAESLITSSISLKKGTDDVSDIYMNISVQQSM